MHRGFSIVMGCVLAGVLMGLPALADEPSLAEMQAQAEALDARDRQVLASLDQFASLYVAPDGKADNPGTEAAPLDLATALSADSPAKAGTVVWLRGGTYQGPFEKAPTPHGTAEQPLIFRAMPGERVTLTASVEARSVLVARGDHVWFWGMEITTDTDVPQERGDAVKLDGGDGIKLDGGDGIKLINLVIHDTPNRSGIGGWNVGSDQEYYGCIVYRVGLQSQAFAHGIYTQNTSAHTVKRITDCLFFDTFGFGVHAYGQDPALANFRFQRVGAWGNALPEGSEKPVVNFLVGGYKDANNIVLRECFTYFPREGEFKRGADLGYIAKDNREMLAVDCTFVGGRPALHVVNWRNATFRGNRLASSHGLIHMVLGEHAAPADYDWDDNTYFAMGVDQPFTTHADPLKWPAHEGSGRHSIETWREAFGLDRQSQFNDAPQGLWALKHENKYDPARVHVIVYNWTGSGQVELDLGDVLENGQNYRLVKLDDAWGEPVASGTYQGEAVTLELAGPYAPEFAGYLLLRD